MGLTIVPRLSFLSYKVAAYGAVPVIYIYRAGVPGLFKFACMVLTVYAAVHVCIQATDLGQLARHGYCVLQWGMEAAGKGGKGGRGRGGAG